MRSVSAPLNEPPVPAAEPSTVLSIFLLSGGLFIFTLQDVIVRRLSPHYPVHELIFIRGALAIWLMGVYVYWRYGWSGFRIVRPEIILLRGTCGMICFMSYYLSLAKLTLAATVTITYSSPIIISLLSVFMLGESVGWRRWAAIFVGFMGVIVVVGPSGNFLDPAAGFAVLSAVTYATMSILTRKLSTQMAGASIAFYQMLSFIVGSILLALFLGNGGFYDPTDHLSIQFMLRPWIFPDWNDFGLIALTALIASFCFIMLTSAYARTSPSIVAPFEYSGVLWGTLAGWIFLAEVPSQWTLIGAGIIVGAGLYILYRESYWGKKPRALLNPALTLPDPVQGPPKD
ncbi:MAG: DMT family transporter [Alphaproteobacteria bacterium]|nr:DMT family transporter [Alphaproteobacteria bacterium]